MKTCQSTLNRYLFVSLLTLLTTFAFLNVEALQPLRIALSSTLGLPTELLWLLASVVNAVVLIVLFKQLHLQLTKPIKHIADQCLEGQVTDLPGSNPLRETRIIREFIRKTQDRAEHRREQISSIEAELAELRKERARSGRKLEELEDLVAAYARIRSELTYDNTNLRRELKDLGAKLSDPQPQPVQQNRIQRFPFANRS
ncbi:hypothetical protein [Pelagicoccus mobilis]|uniref:Uncharacterized protein n=1 Tax=Pelagicoccus mobilis TaxID=415221 RepID=A0A934VRC0_9BACT|nr:hypothetical protein [Pelagicoccus mobilis]MBK1877775.1 hypothetical protein [Pelagicoccus mobilis]